MMTTFLPSQNFTGYPDGDHKNPVRFVVGVESGPVPEEFARQVYENGLAAFVPRMPSVVDPLKAAVSKKIAAATKSRRPGKASGQSSKD